MMINCIIIDDEAKNIKLLQNMLQMYCPSVNVLATDTEAKNGLLLIDELQPQLVFLDVEMPHLNGFDMLKKLEREKTQPQHTVWKGLEKFRDLDKEPGKLDKKA